MKATLWSLAAVGLLCASGIAQTAAAGGGNELAAPKVFPFDKMTVRKAPNGVESRMIVSGTLATGESVGLHETTQPAGTAPSALHVIQHSEMIVVIEGTVEFNHDGKAERVGPGGVIYVALGTNHFVKNVGDGPAKYVVIAIGGDVKK
jgi:quercetin dioxygenase-like cupin family protein